MFSLLSLYVIQEYWMTILRDIYILLLALVYAMECLSVTSFVAPVAVHTL